MTAAAAEVSKGRMKRVETVRSDEIGKVLSAFNAMVNGLEADLDIYHTPSMGMQLITVLIEQLGGNYLFSGKTVRSLLFGSGNKRLNQKSLLPGLSIEKRPPP